MFLMTSAFGWLWTWILSPGLLELQVGSPILALLIMRRYALPAPMQEANLWPPLLFAWRAGEALQRMTGGKVWFALTGTLASCPLCKHCANVFAQCLRPRVGKLLTRKRCANLAQTLLKCCTKVAQTLCKRYRRCANIVQTLCKPCSNNIDLTQTMLKPWATMRKPCSSIAQTLRKYCTNIAQTLHKHAQTLHKHAQTLDHLRQNGCLLLGKRGPVWHFQ